MGVDREGLQGLTRTTRRTAPRIVIRMNTRAATLFLVFAACAFATEGVDDLSPLDAVGEEVGGFFSALQTSGSFTMMQAGGFEEMGESTTTTTTPTNPAKCNGSANVDGIVTGTLDCAASVSAACPDNLSMGCAVYCAQGGSTTSAQFIHAEGSGGKTVVPINLPTSSACNGVISKLQVAHPHKAGQAIGVLALKRVKCSATAADGSTACSTFKRVVCFKAQKHSGGTKNMFASIKEHEATTAEKHAFAAFVKANAWDNPGTANAQMKSAWVCTGDDKKIADGWAAAF